MHKLKAYTPGYFAYKKCGEDMTLKQERFVQEYLIDHNATKAAIRAGYSPKTANRIATELLSKPVILNAIKKGDALIANEINVTRQEIIERYKQIAFDPTAQIRGADAIKALEWLAARLGMNDDADADNEIRVVFDFGDNKNQ
jgi:phage terminase small subunit